MTSAEVDVIKTGGVIVSDVAGAIGGPVASEIVNAVFAVLEACVSGAITTDDAKVQLAAIPVERAKNNAAADEIVKERFHPGDK